MLLKQQIPICDVFSNIYYVIKTTTTCLWCVFRYVYIERNHHHDDMPYNNSRLSLHCYLSSVKNSSRTHCWRHNTIHCAAFLIQAKSRVQCHSKLWRPSAWTVSSLGAIERWLLPESVLSYIKFGYLSSLQILWKTPGLISHFVICWNLKCWAVNDAQHLKIL